MTQSISVCLRLAACQLWSLWKGSWATGALRWPGSRLRSSLDHHRYVMWRVWQEDNNMSICCVFRLWRGHGNVDFQVCRLLFVHQDDWPLLLHFHTVHGFTCKSVCGIFLGGFYSEEIFWKSDRRYQRRAQCDVSSHLFTQELCLDSYLRYSYIENEVGTEFWGQLSLSHLKCY